MFHRRHHRCGLSLIELLVVVTLLGVFATAALMRFGRDTFGDTGARSQARLLSLAMLHAQRAAIRTGDSHGVVMQGPAAAATSWTVVRRRQDGSKVTVEGPHAVAERVRVSANASEMWFDFEGIGSQPFAAQLRGPNRSYTVHVEPWTRMIRTQESSP
ncbi:hypothetical protein Mal15_28010 [Stieleria maiorica]|uniref:General secretion pathway GspH domain-containing protein n=1 Tax=Stieleria maiorica TaxID=2795974 RepID=A0A5B9MF21_9BACT|nr:prepilin-type N-terminal cleavage/methylation domain-containing protein [Stieleria maiorica]QEF98746.1 hypothetical protein Mal15_28010 [Stieleria maiorica]